MDININKDESIDDLDLKGLKLIQKEKAYRCCVIIRFCKC